MTPEQNPIERLVALKRQEQELKAALKTTQQEASMWAFVNHEKPGKLGVIGGANVTLKMMSVKPIKTNEIEDLEELIELKQQALRNERIIRVLYVELEITELEKLMEEKRQELARLMTDDEVTRMKAEVEKLYDAQAGEKKPQLSISFKGV